MAPLDGQCVACSLMQSVPTEFEEEYWREVWERLAIANKTLQAPEYSTGLQSGTNVCRV